MASVTVLLVECLETMGNVIHARKWWGCAYAARAGLVNPYEAALRRMPGPTWVDSALPPKVNLSPPRPEW